MKGTVANSMLYSLSSDSLLNDNQLLEMAAIDGGNLCSIASQPKDDDDDSQLGALLAIFSLVSNTRSLNRSFSHGVTAAILVYQNNETAAMLVFQTNPVGLKLFSYVKTFLCSKTFAWLEVT